MTRALLALAATVALAGCGGVAQPPAAAPLPSSTPSPTASPTPTPGPQAFLDYAHGASFGKKDFATASDDALLTVGGIACDGLANGLPFGRVVQGYLQSDAKPTLAEAEEFTRHAVTNLCPEHAGQLPG